MNNILWHKCHSWFLITTKHLNLFQITIFFKFRTNFCFSKDMPYYKITLNSNSQYFAIYMFSTTRHSTTNNHWVTIYSVEAWHLLYSLLHVTHTQLWLVHRVCRMEAQLQSDLLDTTKYQTEHKISGQLYQTNINCLSR